jgi:hypothetical protein
MPSCGAESSIWCERLPETMARRGEKRDFNIVAAWFSFALFFPILLMSRLA